MYSGHWRDYLATGGRLHYALWSHRMFDGATPLFPGFAVVALSVVALASGDTWRAHRTRAMVVLAVVAVTLSFGAAVPGYHWLYDHVRAAAGHSRCRALRLAVVAGPGSAGRHRARPTRAPVAGPRHSCWRRRRPRWSPSRPRARRWRSRASRAFRAIYGHVAALPERGHRRVPVPRSGRGASERPVRAGLDDALPPDAERLQRLHAGELSRPRRGGAALPVGRVAARVRLPRRHPPGRARRAASVRR